MNANGVLQVQAGAQHEIDENEAQVSRKWLLALSAYMAFMAAVYVFVRVYFAQDRFDAELHRVAEKDDL